MASQALGCTPGATRSAADRSATDEEGTREIAIADGREDTKHPAVGVLRTGDGTYCTGTLIGWRTVLTAAYCVEGGTSFAFRIGGKEYAAAEWACHPSYASWEESYADFVDVAVVKLKDAPPAIPRAVLSSSAPSVGQAITFVGVGRTSADTQSDYTRRAASGTIATVKGRHYSYRGETCGGDAGGPSFTTNAGEERLIGIHSGPAGNTCDEQSDDVRVDAHLGWINEQLGRDGDPDRVPPDVAITSPLTDGASVPANFVVSVMAADELSGVTKVELYIDNQLRETIVGTPGENEPTVFGVKELAPGDHSLRVEAKDAAGNAGQASSAVVVADTLAPTLAIRAPADGATVSSSFTVELEASDAKGVLGEVQVYVDGKLYRGAAESPTMIPVTGLTGGEHEIWAAVQDSAGNISCARATVTVDSSAEVSEVVISSARCGAADESGASCAPSANILVGGCTMVQGPASPTWRWVLLGLLVLLGRRSRPRPS